MLGPHGVWTVQHTCLGTAPKFMEFLAVQYSRYNVFVKYGEAPQTLHFLTHGMLEAKRKGWITIIPDPDQPLGTIELKNEGVSLGYARSLDFMGTPVNATLVGEDGTVTVTPTPTVNQWIRGNGVPLNTLGTNGQYYEEVITGEVYYKVGGIWTLTNIHGVDSPEVQKDFNDNTTHNEAVGSTVLNRAVFIDYTLEVIGKYEVGRIAIVHDGTVANLDVQHTPTSPPRIKGITYAASVSGTDIVLSITANNVGSNLRLKYRKIDYISPTV